MRSPSHDYGREPPRASDGTVIGADGIDPADRVGQESGWRLDEKGRPRFSRERLLKGRSQSAVSSVRAVEGDADAGSPIEE